MLTFENIVWYNLEIFSEHFGNIYDFVSATINTTFSVHNKLLLTQK